MSKPRHTPGPWELDGILMIDGIPQSADVYRDFGCDDDATYEAEPICRDVKIADARLIAAAPDMYEALKAALNYLENTESELGITLDSADACRAALAKATGGQP